MRYDDASQASSANAEPIARADTEVLPQGSFGPATGNAISGAGTTSGANGADSVGAGPASIAAVQGAGGATGQAAGSFHALGQYGVLSMDAQGNFSYVRNPGTPDGVQDVFSYTLADAAWRAVVDDSDHRYRRRSPRPQAGQGIVNLPAGVEMSDIHVNGRDLVIDMPDGTQMVIPGGAVFVPQLAIGDVEVPATNLAALLINSEPQPAAGPPQSSGGNFAVRRSAARSGRSAWRPDSADRAQLLAARVRGAGKRHRPQADRHHHHAGQSVRGRRCGRQRR